MTRRPACADLSDALKKGPSKYSFAKGTSKVVGGQTLYSVPVVALALALQRRIVAGLTLGAVKG